VELILSSKEDMIHLCRQSPEWKVKKEEFFNTIH
jgi:hypothetical protein